MNETIPTFPNSSAAAKAFAVKALPEGVDETPTEYMLRIMRDPTCDAKRRDAMALKLFDAGKKKDEKGEQTKVAIRKFG